MINLLYIGNKLNGPSSNPTMMETLGGYLEQEGFQVSYASSKQNKVFRLLDMLVSVVTNRKKIDYVLIDTYSTQNFYYAYAVSQLCRFFKLKYIPILHGGNLPSRLKNSSKLCTQLFNHASTIVSPSLYLKDVFESFGYKDVVFIPNTIQIKKYPFQIKTIDKPRLFWLRAFKTLYNPEMAIQVAAIIKYKGLDVELCMVGPDGADGSLEKAKKLAQELNINVDFRGKLSKADWIALSQDYNIFINTTNFDNMPVSVIEAMALGFPVVSTNVGGLPYLIDDGNDGLLVEPNDAEQMAEKIIDLSQTPDLVVALTKNAREKALLFDWEEVVKKWINLLK